MKQASKLTRDGKRMETLRRWIHGMIGGETEKAKPGSLKRSQALLGTSVGKRQIQKFRCVQGSCGGWRGWSVDEER